VSPTIPTDRRTITRRIAGGLAAAIAIVYFLIGFEVVTVWEGGVGQRQFGLLAGSAFLAGAVVISFTDKRVLWVLGALAQVPIILAYFDFASEREPAFEPWGITIRVLQVVLIFALGYLASTRPRVERPEDLPALVRN
jgi:hypothetical protein